MNLLRGERLGIVGGAWLLALFSGGCNAWSTLGYNQESFSWGSCPADATVYGCIAGACVVRELLMPPAGSVVLAVDQDDLYFMSSRAPDAISKLPLGGGSPTAVTPELVRLELMTIDENNLYWTEHDTGINSVPKTGGTPVVVAHPFGHLNGLAVDDAYVYGIMTGEEQVVMAPKPSGLPTLLTGQASPRAIAADGAHVFWINAGVGASSGQVLRAPRGDLTKPETIAAGLDSPLVMALSRNEVFWATADTLFRVAKSGGAPLVVGNGFSEPMALVVLGDDAYLACRGGLLKFSVSRGDFEVLDKRPMSSAAIGCSGVYASGWQESALIQYGP